MKHKYSTALLLLTLATGIGSLAGCSDPEREAVRAQMHEKPEITLVGTFDGCEVKFVNRYDRDDSFYLARCDATTTSTQHYDEHVGKSYEHRTRVAITQELKAVDEKREKLQQEAKAAEQRESALSKLTPEERAALGYTEPAK